MTAVYDLLTQRLDAAGVRYRVLEHEPVFTSEQAARVRGTPLASGAKALLCKASEHGFVLVVMPADRRMKGNRVRRLIGTRGLRFASRDELLDVTGLEPGAVPPFGSLFDVPTFCDDALAAQPRINFNAGDHARSLNLAFEDYVAFEEPTLGSFAAPVGASTEERE